MESVILTLTSALLRRFSCLCACKCAYNTTIPSSRCARLSDLAIDNLTNPPPPLIMSTTNVKSLSISKIDSEGAVPPLDVSSGVLLRSDSAVQDAVSVPILQSFSLDIMNTSINEVNLPHVEGVPTPPTRRVANQFFPAPGETFFPEFMPDGSVCNYIIPSFNSAGVAIPAGDVRVIMADTAMCLFTPDGHVQYVFKWCTLAYQLPLPEGLFEVLESINVMNYRPNYPEPHVHVLTPVLQIPRPGMLVANLEHWVMRYSYPDEFWAGLNIDFSSTIGEMFLYLNPFPTDPGLKAFVKIQSYAVNDIYWRTPGHPARISYLNSFKITRKSLTNSPHVFPSRVESGSSDGGKEAAWNEADSHSDGSHSAYWDTPHIRTSFVPKTDDEFLYGSAEPDVDDMYPGDEDTGVVFTSDDLRLCNLNVVAEIDDAKEREKKELRKLQVQQRRLEGRAAKAKLIAEQAKAASTRASAKLRRTSFKKMNEEQMKESVAEVKVYRERAASLMKQGMKLTEFVEEPRVLNEQFVATASHKQIQRELQAPGPVKGSYKYKADSPTKVVLGAFVPPVVGHLRLVQGIIKDRDDLEALLVKCRNETMCDTMRRFYVAFEETYARNDLEGVAALEKIMWDLSRNMPRAKEEFVRLPPPVPAKPSRVVMVKREEGRLEMGSFSFSKDDFPPLYSSASLPFPDLDYPTPFYVASDLVYVMKRVVYATQSRPLVGRVEGGEHSKMKEMSPDVEDPIMHSVGVDVPMIGHTEVKVNREQLMRLMPSFSDFLPKELRESSWWRDIYGFLTMIVNLSGDPSALQIFMTLSNFVIQHVTPKCKKLGDSIIAAMGLKWQTEGGSASKVKAEYPDDPAMVLGLEGEDPLLQPLVDQVMDVPVEEWNDLPNKLFGKTVDVIGSPLGRSMYDLFGLVSISTLLAHTGLFGDVRDVLRVKKSVESVLQPNTSVDTFVVSLFKFASGLVRNMREAIVERDWTLLFGGVRDVEELIKYTSCLLYNQEILIRQSRLASEFESNLANGVYPPGIHMQITDATRVNLLRRCLPDVTTHRQRATRAKDNVMAGTLIRIEQEIMRLVAKESSRNAAGGDRIEPYAYMLYGAAGAAKTTVSKAIFKGYAKHKKLPHSARSMTLIQAGQNFFDTAEDESWGCLMDDLDHAVGSPSYGDLTHPLLFTKIVNRHPFEMEQAAAEKKGSIYANYQVVAYTTNFGHARLMGNTVEPMAFWRRIKHRVHMIVKPEFASASGRIMESKCDGSGNYWRFEIYVFDDSIERVGFDTVPFKLDRIILDYGEFVRFMVLEAASWVKKETTYLQAREVGEMCDYHYVIHPSPCWAMRGEPEPQLQSSILDVSGIPNDIDGEHPPVLPIRAYYRPRTGGRLPPAGGRLESGKAGAIATIMAGSIVGVLTGSIASSRVEGSDPLEEPIRSLGEYFQMDYDPYDTFMFETIRLGLEVAIMAASGAAVIVGLVQLVRVAATEAGYDMTQEPRPAFQIGKFHNFDAVPITSIPLVAHNEARCTTLEDLSRKTIQLSALLSLGDDDLHGHFVYRNFMLCPRHLFIPKGSDPRAAHPISSAISITYPMDARNVVKYDVRFEDGDGKKKNAIAVPNRDHVIIHVDFVPPMSVDLLKYCSTGALSTLSVVDEALLVSPRDIVSPMRAKVVTGYNPVSQVANSCVSYEAITKPGDCGRLLLGRVGRTIMMLGQHVGSYKVEGVFREGRAEFIVEQEIRIAIDSLQEGRLDRQIVAVTGELQFGQKPLTLGPIPEKSSAGTAVRKAQGPVFGLGTLTPAFGISKMKTKVKRNVFDKDFAHLEKEWCGVTPYFEAPCFHGRMDAGEWSDPFVRSMSAYPYGFIRDDVLDQALDLYLDGVEGVSGIDQVRVLTPYEVWRGIAGTNVKPVNLHTSTGAPYFVRKGEAIEFDDESGIVYVAKEIMAMVEEMELLLSMGIAPIPVSCAALKDEPVSAEKNLKHKVRVFWPVSVSHYYVCKKYLRPIAVVIRANPEFFECAVGMNCSSASEVQAFAHFLGRFDDLFDLDYADFDSSQTLPWWVRVVAKFYQRMAKLIGYSEADQRKVYLIVMGLAHAFRVVKSDVILCTGNLSGGEQTLEIGSIINSVGFRYGALMVARKFAVDLALGDWFRPQFGLRTFGDDLAVGRTARGRWMDIEEWRAQMKVAGLTSTPGDKSEFVVSKEITTLTFLKRTLRYDVQYGVWVMPLSKKSLAKMLVIRTTSTLSDLDHYGVILANVMRECVFHGRDFFEEMKVTVDEVAKRHKVDESKFYKYPSFDEAMQLYVKESFTVWVEEASLPLLIDG